VSRHDTDRLSDIVNAIEAIQRHLTKGSLYDGLVYDAVRVRLIEIGEAVKAINPDLLATAPEIPWSAIARMRDHLAHHYFDTDHAVVVDVVDNELPTLLAAVEGLTERFVQNEPAAGGPSERSTDS
jgi:uncharacterized protein with HEPN domain